MAKKTFLDFEQPIAELEAKIEELRYVQTENAVDISDEIDRLSKKSNQLTKSPRLHATLSVPIRWTTCVSALPILWKCTVTATLRMTSPSSEA